MLRPRHEVSVKIAIYKADKSAVLIMKYPKILGLPGGHLEKKETPDEAMSRELQEELGITIRDFSGAGFFLRGERGSAVILGYTAIMPKDAVLRPPRPQFEEGVWMTKEEVKKLKHPETIATQYVQMILENWPK